MTVMGFVLLTAAIALGIIIGSVVMTALAMYLMLNKKYMNWMIKKYVQAVNATVEALEDLEI